MYKLVTQFDTYRAEARLATPTCCCGCCSCCCCSCVVTIVASGVLTARYFAKYAYDQRDTRDLKDHFDTLAKEANLTESPAWEKRVQEEPEEPPAQMAEQPEEQQREPDNKDYSADNLVGCGALIGLAAAAVMCVFLGGWFIALPGVAGLVFMVVSAYKKGVVGAAVTAIILTAVVVAIEFFIWAKALGV